MPDRSVEAPASEYLTEGFDPSKLPKAAIRISTLDEQFADLRQRLERIEASQMPPSLAGMITVAVLVLLALIALVAITR